MKTTLLIIITLLSSLNSIGQLKHWFSYNGLAYSNFFNREKDKHYFPYIANQPSFTYKISKKRVGLEFNYINFYGQNYHPNWDPKTTPDSSILQVTSTLFSFNVNYTFLDKKWLKCNAGIGVTRRWLDQMEVFHYWNGYHLKGDIFAENNNGLNTSFNVVLPLYRGLHFNSTTRYLYFPNSKYSKQNFIGEVGIGYMFQRKSNKS